MAVLTLEIGKRCPCCNASGIKVNKACGPEVLAVIICQNCDHEIQVKLAPRLAILEN